MHLGTYHIAFGKHQWYNVAGTVFRGCISLAMTVLVHIFHSGYHGDQAVRIRNIKAIPTGLQPEIRCHHAGQGDRHKYMREINLRGYHP